MNMLNTMLNRSLQEMFCVVEMENNGSLISGVKEQCEC